MNIIETERLILCHLTAEDAPFIFELVNDPSWLRYIGDKGVRNLEDAKNYILNGPVASYKLHGYGLYLTRLKAGGVPIGICGLVKREYLQDPDVGFAFLPEFTRQGYAYESAAAVLDHAGKVLGLNRILAITSPDNDRSIKVLKKLGLRFDKMIKTNEGEPKCRLYVPGP